MKTVTVKFDEATYQALEETARRDMRDLSTLILMMLRKELGLPDPYEDSPLKENPGLIEGADHTRRGEP
jgi:hypothetical protein